MAMVIGVYYAYTEIHRLRTENKTLRWTIPKDTRAYIERLHWELFKTIFEKSPEFENDGANGGLTWKSPQGQIKYDLSTNGTEEVMIFAFGQGWHYRFHNNYEGRVSLGIFPRPGENPNWGSDATYLESELSPLVKMTKEKAKNILSQKYPKGLFFNSPVLKMYGDLKDPSPWLNTTATNPQNN